MKYTKDNKVETDYVEFYSQNRDKISDLYSSEKRIFNNVNFKGKSILDIGCACGGFYNIFKEIAPDISYFGIDISEKLIKSSKKRYPEIADKFITCSATNLCFSNHSFDIVFCGSVQAHCRQYKHLLSECWRVSKQILIFDFRFSFHKDTYNFTTNVSSVPYMVLNIHEMIDLIKSLDGTKGISFESYMIAPDKNEIVGSDLLDKSDIWCGLFCLSR